MVDAVYRAEFLHFRATPERYQNLSAEDMFNSNLQIEDRTQDDDGRVLYTCKNIHTGETMVIDASGKPARSRKTEFAKETLAKLAQDVPADGMVNWKPDC